MQEGFQTTGWFEEGVHPKASAPIAKDVLQDRHLRCANGGIVAEAGGLKLLFDLRQLEIVMQEIAC
ncbi:MAG: hypothetical protein ACK8QZ_03105, partial [Anaerolineales bacterium]